MSRDIAGLDAERAYKQRRNVIILSALIYSIVGFDLRIENASIVALKIIGLKTDVVVSALAVCVFFLLLSYLTWYAFSRSNNESNMLTKIREFTHIFEMHIGDFIVFSLLRESIQTSGGRRYYPEYRFFNVRLTISILFIIVFPFYFFYLMLEMIVPLVMAVGALVFAYPSLKVEVFKPIFTWLSN